MIRLILGKMGSGKTASVVREMCLNIDDKITYSNIIIKNNKKYPFIKQIKRDMIITKDKTFNKEYWIELSKKNKAINVVLDEAHTLIDSRRFMSKENKIMMDFIALLRRVLGDSGDGYGELILITQLGRRLDIISRELATNVQYHICHYNMQCLNCSCVYKENNESKEKIKFCIKCGCRKFKRYNFVIEKFEFENCDDLNYWINTREKSYFKHYYIMDIEKYFPFYNTHQWENLISEY